MKKKWIVGISLILVLLLVLAGCQNTPVAEISDNNASEDHVGFLEIFEKGPEPLRICVDMAYLGIENEDPSYSFESAVEGAVQGLVLEVAARGGPQDIEIEVIPKEEAARKSALTRIRTEIMSGEGPDIFIMGCAGGPLGREGDALFPIPEKAMRNSLFLPLDEYMENNTQFTEWAKLQPAVLNAGRNEYGQQIIPISYTLPVTFYRAAEVTHKPSAETTWNDMVQGETAVLSTAATWDHMRDGLIHMRGNYIEYTFGQLADYETEKLTFTEDELLQRIIEIRDLYLQYEAGAFGDVPTHYQTCLSVDFNNGTGTNYTFAFDSDPFGGIKPSDAQTMIPIYCDDGGTTATILSYAAINVNTRWPEDAFFVLDVLMDRRTQQTSVLYENWFTSVYGIPMHTDLMQPKYPTMYTNNSKMWYLIEENYTELCRVREQITSARFRGGLDVELDDAYYAYVEAVRQGEKNNEELREIITEAYSRMKRLLGE